MSDPVVALGGASFDGYVQLREAGLTGMVTLRGALDHPGLQEEVYRATQTTFPDTREAQFAGEFGLLWMSPDELMILCPYAQADALAARLSDALTGQHALVVNVSDARAMFTLTGAKLREVLAKLAPADLAADRFPTGEVRRTRLAQIPAAFWLRSDTQAQLLCFRSVARYAFDVLSVAAQPGSEIDAE